MNAPPTFHQATPTHTPHRGPSRASRWLAGLAFAGLLATSTAAQGTLLTETRSRQWESPTYGNSSFGGSLGASASVTRDGLFFAGFLLEGNHRSSAELHGNVKVFGQTMEAARLQVDAANEPYNLSTSGATLKPNYKPNTSLLLRLAGFTVWNPSVAQTSFSHTFALNLGFYNRPTVSVGAQFWLLGIPITVSAGAGVSASSSLTVTADLASVSLEVTGYARGRALGTAQAGFGFGFASAGIRVRLTFASPSIQPTLRADFFSGITGQMRVCKTNVDLLVQLYAEISLFWGRIRRAATVDVIHISSPEVCTDLVLI